MVKLNFIFKNSKKTTNKKTIKMNSRYGIGKELTLDFWGTPTVFTIVKINTKGISLENKKFGLKLPNYSVEELDKMVMDTENITSK